MKSKIEELSQMAKIMFIILTLSYHGSSCQQQAPGLDVIGKGYDIFGEYANNVSMKRYSLFLFPNSQVRPNSYEYKIPDYLILENISDHRIKEIQGNSIAEYSENLQKNLNIKNNALIFAGSINAQFGKNNVSTNEYHYFTYMDANTKWRISIDTRNPDKLLEILDPTFNQDLNNLPVAKVFERYGTHFIASAYLGGRADYSSSTKRSSSFTEEDVKVTIKARYANIKGEFRDSKSQVSEIINNNSQFNLRVVGGNSEFANDIKDKYMYDKWAEGIKDKPVLCDFDEESLVPIWSLTADQTRKRELEKYFNETILPLHPKPTFVKPVISTYEVSIYGFNVINDCETVLMSPGEFEYNYMISVNGDVKYKSGPVRKDIDEGQWCVIEKKHSVSFENLKESNFSISFGLREIDDIGGVHDILSPNPLTVIYKFPYRNETLFNYKDEKGNSWNKYELKQDELCKVNLFYQVKRIYDQKALNMGNEGWKEFEKGNYDKCVTLSKEALEIDNSMYFAQFNIALVTLVKGDPLSVSKYKYLLQMCGEKDTIKGALQDIIDFEASKGPLKNSSEIKSMLKLKLTEL